MRYGTPPRPLEDVAESLELCDGMSVTLYYDDRSEEFEVAGYWLDLAARSFSVRQRHPFKTPTRLFTVMAERNRNEDGEWGVSAHFLAIR